MRYFLLVFGVIVIAVMIVAGKRGERTVRKMFRAENTVDYYDREKP